MQKNSNIQPIVKPLWTKPLDSVGSCLERIDTEDYAHDWGQHLRALSFLAYRRSSLPYDVEFSVPQGPDRFNRINDPAWKDIVSLTEDVGGSGEHRMIVGGAKSSQLVTDADLATTSSDDPIYLLPRGLHPRQTLVQLSIKMTEDGPFLTFNDRPFTSSSGFNGLFSVRGYDLAKVADSMAKSGKKPPLTQGKNSLKWTLLTIEAIDPAARSVTIRPNAIFSVIRD